MLQCLRFASYEASIQALKESRAYLNDVEYLSLARAIIAPFITEHVTHAINDALDSALKQAIKSTRAE